VTPQALLTPASPAAAFFSPKSMGITTRDVFDDLQSPAPPPGLGDMAVDSAAEVGAARRSEEDLLEAAAARRSSIDDGKIKSHRGGSAAGEESSPADADGLRSPPLTERSDAFDFLTTPRTDAARFGPPQVGLGLD